MNMSELKECFSSYEDAKNYSISLFTSHYVKAHYIYKKRNIDEWVVCSTLMSPDFVKKFIDKQ